MLPETKIFIGDDYLGKLRPESHEEAVKNNWLKNNQPLQLKLDSIVNEGKHPYAIATTQEGNQLYVNIEEQYKLIDGEMQAIPNKFKGYSFDSEQVQARPIVEKTGQKPIAYLNDKPIGTISQEDFKKIEPTGASLIPKPAKIEGNITTLKVSLDRETIQYPETWVKEREEVTGKESIAINTSEESYKVDQISSKLYQNITTRQAIAFEDTVDSYTNTINLAIDERQLEATEKYLNKNNVEFQVTENVDRPLETSKGLRVITIDKESLDDKLFYSILSRTGGIKSNKIEVPEFPIFKEESAYYFDPKANYGDNEYPAIGLAVPAPDSNIVNQFLDKYNLEISGFNDGNISYFSIIDIENLSYKEYNELYPASEDQFKEYKQNLVQLKKDLSSHLGNPLDLGGENSFHEFDKRIAAIQENLNNGYSTLERNRDVRTEYQQALQKLPNRPNIEGYIEPPAPDISIVKKRKEARAVLRIGSAYNPQTQESGASAILVSSDGKKQIAQAANYYPSEKGDLKAAYQSLIQGLNEAQARGYKALRIETSNNNLYQRLKGNPQYMHFNGKNKECEPLHKQAIELAKSFEWGISPKFTSYKKYPTAAQANQVATDAIAQKNSVNDFGRSQPQQSPPPAPNRTQQPASSTPSQTVSRQSPAPKQQTAPKKRAGLTEGQKEALSKMIEFSQQPKTDKDNNEFLLEGYAGTGKTFVIQQFLKEVRKSGENPKIAFTAPTNNAVKVLRDMADKQGMTGFDAKTTHKLLGLKKNIDKASGEVGFTRKKNSKRPELKYDYIVVDEASMLNKSLYEHCKEASQAGVKVIYMGDPAQLPPVNESESMVFSQVKNRSELTEVVRYEGDMARIAEDIRNNLRSKNPTPIQNSQDGTVIALSKEGFKDKVKELFTSDEFKTDNSSIKVIAYSNNRVDEINQLVKDTLYGEDTPEYLPGMRIIARNPVKGEFGTALDTAEEMTIVKADRDKTGNLDIWKLQGINENGDRVEFETLDSESKPLFKGELDKLRTEIYSQPVTERDWSQYYDLAEKFGNVRPAYAITAHNSQGKTIPKGIVDQENINMRLSMALKEEDAQERARGIKEYNQLRYVAMTRFQSTVYVGTGQREQEINRSQTKNSPNTQNTQQWARYAPIGKESYELSSAGDSRFSALNARLKDGRTIEEAYQLDVKGYRSQGNDWQLGKGKPPLKSMTKEESYEQYKDLWKQWANENPQLIDELAQKASGKVLTDKFASTDISQARALAEILNEIFIQNSQAVKPTPISLPSSKEADKSKSLEIVGKISESKVKQLRQHLDENYKPLMDNDKSNYAPGRQVAWINAKWELKDKDFSPAVKDDKLMELVKQVYPDADIALVTYSEKAGQGIDYHRDDSYAAAEARSINIGDSMWGYQESKQGMVAWNPSANENAPIQEFKLESGTVTRFNSKNPHAALETSAGRWSINVWSIKNDLGKNNSVREKFDKFQASNQPPTAVVKTDNDLTIKNSEWTPGGEIKIERIYPNLQEANTARIIRASNTTTTRAVAAIEQHKQQKRTVNITFDGASRNNGKPDAQASAAAVLTNPEGRTKEFSQYLGNKTNNEAEFQAAIIGMKAAQNFGYKSIQIQGDSQLVIESLQGNRNIKAENLKPLYEEAVGLLQSFDKAQISYIPREQNKAANALANKTLDNTQIISEAVESKSQNSNKISKITSIGQFGADLGALEAASDRGIKTGGVAANGYFTEKGAAPDLLKSYGLNEGEKGKGFGQTYKNAYSANIRNADATVLVGRILNRNESTDKDLVEIINRYNKPYLVIPKEEVLSNPQTVGEKIAQFASQNNVQSLNIIGERESHAPGIQNAVREAIGKTLELNRREGVREGERERKDMGSKVEIPKQQNLTQSQTKESSSSSTQTKTQPIQNIGTTISAYSKDGLGAALSSETKLASDLGNLQNNYPVSYQDNKELPAGNYGGENYPEIKPKGQPFASANQAYHAYQQPEEQATQKIARMTEILKAKLEQHPRLVNAIAKRGGVEFLENSTHISSSQDKFWDGTGKESKFIQALSTAYTATIDKSQSKVSTKEADPVAQSLQKWAEDAQFLNRNYVETINQIQNIYANTKKPLTENHLKTMDKDSKEAAITSDVKNLVTRLTNTLVQDTREDGSKLVQGKKYILESNENTGFTRITNASNADILLTIENNQVKADNLNSDVYQSLKSAVQAVDEKIKSAQEITDYNNSKPVNNVSGKNQVSK